MHVALILSFYGTPRNPVAGAFFRDQAHALRDAGVRVGVVAVPEKAPWQAPHWPGRWPAGIVWEDDAGVATVRGYHVRVWPGYNWLRLKDWVRYGLRVFEAYVEREGRPDIVHAHGADPAGLLAAEIRQRYKTPMVLTEHSSRLALGAGGRTREVVASRAIAAADAGIAVSPHLAARLASYMPEPRGGWLSIPNCVARAFLEASRPAKPAEGFRLLTVGNLVPIKGHDVLLRSFARAFGGESDVSLHIGGQGVADRDLRRLAARLELGGRVRFLGALTREEVLREMLGCNTFVLPSRFETFGVVLVEALATGTPVVATRTGGSESIVDDRMGILVEPDDVEGLAGALRWMRREWSRFDATALRDDARSRFGPDRGTQRILEVYRGVSAR